MSSNEPGGPGTFRVRRRGSGSQRALRRGHEAFTRADIIRAVHDWVDRYGEPPAMVDWDPSRARRLGHAWRAERFEAGCWPSSRVVSSAFEGFNAALVHAGYATRPAPTRIRANVADRDGILEAIREWVRRYGDVPAMADWDPARARRLKQDWRISRYYHGDWPSARTVAHHFGSLSAAITAAGLQPRLPSSQRADRNADRLVNRNALARLAAAERQPGIKDFAGCLRALALARKVSDPVALHAALIDIASAAIAWAEAPHVQ
jgi:hypothetical protein